MIYGLIHPYLKKSYKLIKSNYQYKKTILFGRLKKNYYIYSIKLLFKRLNLKTMKKVLFFVGVCMRVDNLWSGKLEINSKKQIEPEEIEILEALPPLETLPEGVICKYPTEPVDGPNVIEGWVLSDNPENLNDILEKFCDQFALVHNPRPNPMEQLLSFLQGIREVLEESNKNHEEHTEEHPEEQS